MPVFSIVITVYVRKEEATVYNALLLDSLTVHDFKLQVLYELVLLSCIYTVEYGER